MLFKTVKTNGIYNIVDHQNKSFPVFCDFASEPGAAWTLIQSHSLQNNAAFKKAFYLHDIPVNEDAPEWEKYRLSMLRMKSIRNVSTHYRATCNFTTDGVDYRDYWRVSLQSLDLFPEQTSDSGFCLLSEFVNIRGNNCINCTVLTGYSSVYSLHMDSWYGQDRGCEFNGRPGGKINEDNFGFYSTINPNFRCTFSNNSTSQFWLGGF